MHYATFPAFLCVIYFLLSIRSRAAVPLFDVAARGSDDDAARCTCMHARRADSAFHLVRFVCNRPDLSSHAESGVYTSRVTEHAVTREDEIDELPRDFRTRSRLMMCAEYGFLLLHGALETVRDRFRKFTRRIEMMKLSVAL